MNFVVHPSLELLEKLRRLHHSKCFACASDVFRLEFTVIPDGGLEAIRAFGDGCCSYDGLVHGGLLSLCIDEAMTCNLMAHGVVAVTGRLNLRYLHPVQPGVPAVIRSRLCSANAPLFEMEASIWQDEAVLVRGSAKFMIRSGGERRSACGSSGLTASLSCDAIEHAPKSRSGL